MMIKLTCVLAVLLLLIRRNQSYSPKTSEERSRLIRFMMTSPNLDSDVAGDVEKRYSSQQLIDMKSRKFELDAIKKLLRRLYIGKRQSPDFDGDSEIVHSVSKIPHRDHGLWRYVVGDNNDISDNGERSDENLDAIITS